MKLFIAGSGAIYEQAKRLADALGAEVVSDASEAELVLPATENDDVLGALGGNNVLFDPDAWALCSSRLAADSFLREHDIPAPAYFPGGAEPYLVKPDRGSFGKGIWVTDDYCEVGGAVNAGFVTQEELPGDVWSAAVTGTPGSYTVHPAAKLTYDSGRHRVSASCEAPPDAQALADTAEKIAALIGVRGVLEVEAIYHLGVWKVIDLNARLPMFTADALLDRGVNLLEELVKAYK